MPERATLASSSDPPVEGAVGGDFSQSLRICPVNLRVSSACSSATSETIATIPAATNACKSDLRLIITLVLRYHLDSDALMLPNGRLGGKKCPAAGEVSITGKIGLRPSING